MIALCSGYTMKAQYNTMENKVWAFGFNAGLDFNFPNPVSIITNTGIPGSNGESNASVCNKSGKLLFYTDGSTLWRRDGSIMANGQNLTGLGSGVTNSTSQGALIIPVPDQNEQYYVFSLTSVDQVSLLRGRLYYSVVHIDAEGNSGIVEPNKKGILIDSGLTEKMIGIVGDRCNIWVLTCIRGQAAYKAFEITSNGLNTIPVISNTGKPKVLSFGCLAVSPNRKYIAATETTNFGGTNGLELSRFDPATGQVSHSMQLDSLSGYYGVCFSPDNSKLYGNSFTNLYQFDLDSSNPIDSKILIRDGGKTTGLQAGPDGKIYLLYPGSLNAISAIAAPNQSGLACMFIPNQIPLLSSTSANFNFQNTVPVFKRDTLLRSQEINAGCFAREVQVSATDSSGWGYLWSTGSTGLSTNIDRTGTYWLTYYTTPCIFHTDTFLVQFPYGILPIVQKDNSCRGTANGRAWVPTFPGDTLTYNYTWTNISGDTLSHSDSMLQVTAGTYLLHMGTAHCDTLVKIYIGEEQAKVSFSADTLACTADTIRFRNTSDSYFKSYNWQFGDNNTTHQTNPEHLYKQAGRYQVMLIGEGVTCPDTAIQYISLDAPVQKIGFDKNQVSLCMGQSVTFYPVTDSTTHQLLWDFGDGHTLSNTPGITQHAYDSAGNMPVLLTATFRVCPQLEFRDTIAVYPLPVVDLGPDASICLSAPVIILRQLNSEKEGNRYLWSTGENTSSIRVNQPGGYSLTITDKYNCSATENLTIHKDCYINIPNAFTPNGDGQNDYFLPRQSAGTLLSRFKIQVFNRVGQLLFNSEEKMGSGWDGKFNGKEQPAGVYVYYIEIGIGNTAPEKYQGNISLIR